jgi:hypothetical protein
MAYFSPFLARFWPKIRRFAPKIVGLMAEPGTLDLDFVDVKIGSPTPAPGALGEYMLPSRQKAGRFGARIASRIDILSGFCTSFTHKGPAKRKRSDAGTSLLSLFALFSTDPSSRSSPLL